MVVCELVTDRELGCDGGRVLGGRERDQFGGALFKLDGDGD